MTGRRVGRLSQRHAVLAALLLLVALLGPTAGAAQMQRPSRPRTWAGEWQVTGSGAALAGSLHGLERDAGRQHLILAPGVERGYLETPPRDMGHEFGAVAAIWTAETPKGTSLEVEVQVSADGRSWGPWYPLLLDELGSKDAAEGVAHSELLFERGRYVRLRVALGRGKGAAVPRLKALKLVAIDASDGPSAPQLAPAAASVATTPPAPPGVISRAAWGANEAYMTWPPEYAKVTHFVIHHTATSNASADADPYQVVRTIYYYHAVTLGWGDIGYNFVVDRQGRIYEGRYGGDGVIGGHARPYNRGTVGIALLGDYGTSTVPPAAALGIEKLLHWKCAYHGVNPLGSSWIYDRTLPNIMGHRDCNQTTCPGDRLYALLPTLRTDVANMLSDTAPQVTITSPQAGATVSGVLNVSWQVNWAVSEVSIYLDGNLRQAVAASSASWTWDTLAVSDGTHQLRVVARNPLGQSASSEVSVQVNNTPPRWLAPGAGGLAVEAPAGLVSSADYATSTDGLSWSQWVSVTLAMAPDGQSGTLAPQPSWEGCCVRARASDSLGRTAYSPAIRWPAADDPAPEYRWWGDCGARVWMPLILR
ncbi:MAG: N-acetylmuramoyl-L-alanine amidase [Anaerolineae bacterium]|nr:N-acetylmuramoyl-L-alanine amidase [Anaerolineae bacterium]